MYDPGACQGMASQEVGRIPCRAALELELVAYFGTAGAMPDQAIRAGSWIAETGPRALHALQGEA